MSTLYLVPTPIGNLQDITFRSVNTLKQVDCIAAEDTRRTKILLKTFSIKTRIFSFNSFNERKKTRILIKLLKEKKTVALVSDSGTPLINDPGFFLVNSCWKENIRVVPLPGPCAAITALSASGMPTHRFCFEGFLPSKKKSRIKLLKNLIQEPRTMIFYESPHRILASLEDMIQIFGIDRRAVLAKELTKIWETFFSAPIGKLFQWIKEKEERKRGEIIILIKGSRLN